MDSITSLTDEEVVERARAGDNEAVAEIVRRLFQRRYRYYYRIAPTYWFKMGEGECNAVFFSTILDCIENYRSGPVAFAVYFEEALHHNLFRNFRSLFPEGEMTLSLDQYIGDEEDGTCLADSIPCSCEEDPRIAYSLKERVEQLEELKKQKLSSFDIRVSDMRNEGKSYRFIAERFHCTIKRVRVACDHYRNFLRKYLG